MNVFFDSDLAEERRTASFKSDGILFSQKEDMGIKTTDIRITTEEGEEALGKPRGRYLTVSFNTSHILLPEGQKNLCKAIGDAIAELLSDFKRLLILGLGNRHLRADCIGVLCAEGTVLEADGTVFSLTPGTLGQTGIEAATIARAARDAVGADAVLAIDALAARDKDRLLRTVELCDTGISPGTGVGNPRQAVNEKTVGARVVALGVPTVMRAAAFLKNAFLSAGVCCEDAEKYASVGKKLFTVPMHLDEEIDAVAKIITDAIETTIERIRGTPK